jgi:hypothetical protein
LLNIIESKVGKGIDIIVKYRAWQYQASVHAFKDTMLKGSYNTQMMLRASKKVKIESFGEILYNSKQCLIQYDDNKTISHENNS